MNNAHYQQYFIICVFKVYVCLLPTISDKYRESIEHHAIYFRIISVNCLFLKESNETSNFHCNFLSDIVLDTVLL